MDQNGHGKVFVEPSPMKAIVKKVIGSVICAYLFMTWTTVYPIRTLAGKTEKQIEKKKKQKSNVLFRL